MVLAVVFFLLPIAELAVIIAVGEAIGYGVTLLSMLVISILGAVLAKREGGAVWRRFRAAIKRGEVPSTEIVDGFLVLLGAALLLTPGFLTDVIGVLMLVPGPRSWVKRIVLRFSKVILIGRFPVVGAAASGHETWRRTRSARVVDVSSTKDPAASDKQAETPQIG